MNKILKRDEYINEVYNPMMEQKEYEEMKMVNEGILKNLFGKIKNLFKKEWETIDDHGNPEIVKIYKEFDDKLTGFSTMKLSKKSECNQIRQALVDFACDWYEMKMNAAKKNEADPKPAKSMVFKNDTLKSNLEMIQDKIKTIASGDTQMMKWAQLLMNDMKSVINRSILEEIKDENVKKETQKDIDNQSKKNEEINKKAEKLQSDQLKEIEKERETLISGFRATPEKGDTQGDKEIAKLYAPFNNKDLTKEELVDYVNNGKDKLLGLQEIFKKSDKSIGMSNTAFSMLKSFYDQLNKDSKLFAETPAQSIQAMCIAVNSFVKMSNMKNLKLDTNQVKLMAKCAILSDGVVSYNLPLNDKTGKEAGNYFTDTVAKFKDGFLADGKTKMDLTKLKQFQSNAPKLFKEIKTMAEKLMKEEEKKSEERQKNLDVDEK